MKYYYVMSSLPVLLFGHPPPLAPERFLFDCFGLLSERDYRELVQVMEGDEAECHSPFAEAWFGFQDVLGMAVAEVRAGRIGLEPSAYYPQHHEQYDANIEQIVIDAFVKTDPLERESLLDRARWYILDQFSIPDPFTLSAVLAAGVKLQIMQRWAGMHAEPGHERLKAAVHAAGSEAAWL